MYVVPNYEIHIDFHLLSIEHVRVNYVFIKHEGRGP